MTTERFTTKNIICSNYCVWDNDDKPYGNDEVVELLNELHEENQQLKKDIKQIHTYIDNAILTERTRMGKNCLKQLKEGLQ